jgi:hypothetical protein
LYTVFYNLNGVTRHIYDLFHHGMWNTRNYSHLSFPLPCTFSLSKLKATTPCPFPYHSFFFFFWILFFLKSLLQYFIYLFYSYHKATSLKRKGERLGKSKSLLFIRSLLSSSWPLLFFKHNPSKSWIHYPLSMLLSIILTITPLSPQVSLSLSLSLLSFFYALADSKS